LGIVNYFTVRSENYVHKILEEVKYILSRKNILFVV